MPNLMLIVGLLLGGGLATDSVPLYDDLGDHHYEVTTAVPLAQQYFDQGLRLYYAFNQPESIRSFRAAQRLDPECAMCWWGEALAWGPNINMPMDSAAGVAAYAAVQKALGLASNVTGRERSLIEALGVRYEATPPTDRARLDSAYTQAMAAVVERYPDDPEAAVLYGESIMDLRPWDYWMPDGTTAPGIDRALAQFERVQAANPDHPGACHFFIHAVEEVDPDRAVPCAERLAELMPGAGHLVHMPGHIYIRVGRYMDAVKANHHAVHADETYIQDQRPGVNFYTGGYYPHNYDFLAFAESMTGRSDAAMEAAEKLADLVPQEMLGHAAMGFLEHWLTRPLQIAIRYGRWDYLLRTPAPDSSLSHARAMWHYARGRALAATGAPGEADDHLEQLRTLAADPARESHRLEFNTSASVLAIAVELLAGKVALASGDTTAGIRHLRQAVVNEDALLYGEPPEWTVPARQDLGAALLAAGRPAEAEAVFREDLERFRENGWSLQGLQRALEDQGRPDEAEAVRARFGSAWKNAEVQITGPVF